MIRTQKETYFNIGHIIVDIEEMSVKIPTISRMVIMNNAITKINKEENFFRTFINFQYYLFSYYISFLRVIFSKKYVLNKIIFFKKMDKELVKEKSYTVSTKSNLFLYDRGIYFHEILVPYENILSFGVKDNFCVIEVLATIEVNEDKIILKLNGDIIKIVMELENPTCLRDNIKKNMYYHIKYNEIDENAIHYYYKKIF